MSYPIYQLWNAGLGDHWASINLLGRMAQARREAVYFRSEPRFADRHEQILAELNLDFQVLPSSAPATKGLDGYDVWAALYFATYRRWDITAAEPMACFHFDGESSAAEKNAPDHDRAMIIQDIIAMGLEPVKLTGKLSIPTIVSLLSRCALFVGVDSGMSHIAHSVGCPTYLLEYNLPVVTCHRHKNYVLCRGAQHFAAQARTWATHMRMLGYARN